MRTYRRHVCGSAEFTVYVPCTVDLDFGLDGVLTDCLIYVFPLIEGAS